MIDLLTDCAIFCPVDATTANYYQLSGHPISELEPRQIFKKTPAGDSPTNEAVNDIRTPCKIAFVRNRMLYSKPAPNAKGGIRFGLRHIRQYLFHTVFDT